jgi:hypothetical protein
METLWVLENVKKDLSFYSRLQIWLLVASVSLWRKYHPHHKTVFYADDITLEHLKNFNIFHLWHDVRPLCYPEKINREIFWSSPKTKIISETEIPLLLVDHDFLIFRSIDEHLADKLIYSYDERADNWYPPENDVYNGRLTTPITRINDLAANVSFFYLPDPKFSRKYGRQVLKNHEEFTAMNSPYVTTNHMILSEQLMLKQWLCSESIPHQCLSKNIWDCKKADFYDVLAESGIWDLKETRRSYKHYGVEEMRIREHRTGYNYNETIEFLKRCVTAGKLMDVTELENNINTILNA